MKYLSVLNSTLDGIIVANRSGRIIFSNFTANKMLGYSTDELIGKPIELLLPQSIRHGHVGKRTGYIAAPKPRIMNQNRRFTAVRKDGSEFPITVSLNPTNIDGEIYISTSIQDLTKIEEDTVKLEHSQKLEALGEMVSGIAHNFNNVIAGISGQAYMLARHETCTEKGISRINSINSLCSQATDIIKQLMVYARAQNDKYINFDLGKAVSEVVKIAEISSPEKIAITSGGTEISVVVNGMRTQIQQTLLNIINNAIQAIGNKSGTISIAVMSCLGNRCNLSQCSLNRDGAAEIVCIRVKDTGGGISQNIISRIFDPFFTTKPTGQGTGLGLSTSYGIIKKHGGEISVSSNGEGTLFQIFLPIADNNVQEAVAHSAASPAAAVKQALILIIDDDPTIRDILADILFSLGYSTLKAINGEDT